MLAEPQPTPYDLNFRLFGFPIRIHPLFWLGAALFGQSYLRDGLDIFLIWVAAVFISILIHELGHGIAFRWFGTGSHIVLYVFGGLASPWSTVVGKWRRAIVALAGPCAGFLLAGVLFGSNYLFHWATTSHYLGELFIFLFLINLFWGIFNLLPVWPLDGGQVCREVCTAMRSNGVSLSLNISLVVAGLIAVYSLACAFDRGNIGQLLEELPWWIPRGGIWTAILFGVLAYQSYQLLQVRGWYEPREWDDRPPWRK